VPDPGGEEEPGGLVPPYEGRSTGRSSSATTEANAESIERQLRTASSGNAGATASAAEEHPVDPSEVSTTKAAGEGEQTATDTTAASPHGVGVSYGRRGEEVAERDGKEAGRDDEAREHQDRPAGSSGPRDSTGVHPQDPAEGAPNLQTGDQGG
jgi:hypothetical protein